MAKAKNRVDKGDKGKSKGEEAPEGFTETVSTTERGAGWVIKKEGVIVQGRLLGRQEMSKTGRDGSARAFYRVKLQRDCLCVVGKGDDSQEATIVPGEVVNVDESYALQELEPRTRDGGVYDVWIRYGKQDEDSKFWPADIKLRVIEEPTRETTKRVAPKNGARRRDDRDRDDRPYRRDDDDHDYGRPTRDRDD